MEIGVSSIPVSEVSQMSEHVSLIAELIFAVLL